jgi:hypothetical protein
LPAIGHAAGRGEAVPDVDGAMPGLTDCDGSVALRVTGCQLPDYRIFAAAYAVFQSEGRQGNEMRTIQ